MTLEEIAKLENTAHQAISKSIQKAITEIKKMSNKYKIRIIKKYGFELEGKSQQDIQEQINYIMSKTKILDMPYVRKTIRTKIKKAHERSCDKSEKNS